MYLYTVRYETIYGDENTVCFSGEDRGVIKINGISLLEDECEVFIPWHQIKQVKVRRDKLPITIAEDADTQGVGRWHWRYPSAESLKPL